MNIIKTTLPNVLLIEPKVFGDQRGFFMESYNHDEFKHNGIPIRFIQDNHSLSEKKGTIRGMHYQLSPKAQTKLVRVTRGAIFDVVVDIRKGSPTYGKWEGFYLSAENKRQLLVPKGFAHGFCTLEDFTEVQYKVDELYSAEHDRGILWNDPNIGIKWPEMENPMLSDKDKVHPVLENADNNFLMEESQMNLLVTGGMGFIGSNFIQYMIKNHPAYQIINLDALTYAGNMENLKAVEGHPNYTFVKGDIRNKQLVDFLVKKHNIDTIVNFAAESHVDRSITDPDIFIQTNVLGTQTLLDVAKENEIKKYVQISTDEVYGSLGETGYFTENSPIRPNSPYSSSKAGADMLVQAYYETYGLHTNITRCSNNYGPYHFPEKLIPLAVTNALEGKEIPVYGDGKNIRDWLHVQDHCAAIDLVIHKGKPGEVYNIGGHNERTNNEIVKLIVEKLGASPELIKYVSDRLGHDRRYAIDPTKIEQELGWSPNYTFDTGIVETINWYMENQEWWNHIKSGSYQQYYDKQYGQKTCVG